MKKIVVVLVALLLCGCDKVSVMYCDGVDVMKDKICYKETLSEAKFRYYCPNGMGEVVGTTCMIDNEITGSALKEYYCETGKLNSENSCVVTTTYDAKTKKVSSEYAKKYEEKYNTNIEDNKEDNQTSKKAIREIEGIVYDENKVNIYEFYGQECPHCIKLNSFFERIESEYGNFYKLNKFETWHNSENLEIYKEFASALGYEAKGVPFIVIGNQVIRGFSESKEQEIIDAITSQYKNSYDVYFDARK
mgnify:CR=1 FL=1